ncbi:MAG TPA: transposase family protein [Polyangiaceae bacterium]|nr:transposase family protein [Polyangiaceae bacterium]
MAARMNRRLFGMLSKRLDEAGLDEIADERDDRGKRWQLGALLRAALGSMLTGAKSLAEVETLSERLSRPMRRLLGVQRRLPDTTLRSALCTIEPDRLRKPLHALGQEGAAAQGARAYRAALRRRFRDLLSARDDHRLRAAITAAPLNRRTET